MPSSNKTALVTGSTDGVGRHVAIRLARQGAEVLLHGRDRQRGQDALNEIRRGGGTAAFYQADFSSLDGVRALAEQLAGDRITVNCLHPATYMGTTMVREAGIPPASTVEDGADAILRLATSPELEGRTGLYFNRVAEARAHPQAYDAAARARLRQLSLDLTGLSRS